MAALVQTIPQQTSTVPVLPTRPSSSSAAFTSPSTPTPAPRFHTMSWGSYSASHSAVAPYAFAGPNVGHANNIQHRQSWSPHMRPEHRTSSAPSVHQGSVNPAYAGVSPRIAHHPAAGSVSTSSSSNSSFRSYASKDDSAIPSRQVRRDQPLRPLSIANIPSPPSFMNISSPAGSAKPSPNRYRRSNQRVEAAATLSPPAVESGPTMTADDQPSESDAVFARTVLRSSGHNRVPSADDTLQAGRTPPELAKRYRRRSLGNLDPASYPGLQLQQPTQSNASDSATFEPNRRPHSAQSQQGSAGSIHSVHSATSSVPDGAAADANTGAAKSGKQEDSKRTSKPSPLSQPASTVPDSPTTAANSQNKTSPELTQSPAAKRLADLKNESRRPGKSRLRRAFSFGSASELLKASTQSNASKREAIAAEKARRKALEEELGPEKAAIAEQQEAGGLGESIYSHQGNFFTGSTDNLSLSSTASSASIMLRRMGKGVKRSTRSLVGLFRPKLVVTSINSTEGPSVEPTAPQISVVNVEAEREVLTVNADPQDMPHAGTVFPRVEINGSDGGRAGSIRENAALDTSQSRKGIVGGDRERAEVLAAVRKGILKKTNSDLAVSSRALGGSESPHSSAPTTPDESGRIANRPTESVKIAGEDYFLSEGGRYTGSEAKSAPITPQTVSAKSLVFSPRIQFHETWPSGEYDRRGEIATCNRLTPLLAQQIREEINNFKMEMEVHENSKIYTHFI